MSSHLSLNPRLKSPVRRHFTMSPCNDSPEIRPTSRNNIQVNNFLTGCLGHHPFHSTVCVCDVNQHSRHDYRIDPAIETYHCEIILAVLPFATGQNFLFCGGVPQLDCAIITPGRQPLPVGREGH